MFNFFKKKTPVDIDKASNISEIESISFDFTGIPYNNTVEVLKKDDLKLSVKKTNKSAYFIVGRHDENGIMVKNYIPFHSI